MTQMLITFWMKNVNIAHNEEPIPHALSQYKILKVLQWIGTQECEGEAERKELITYK